MSRIQQAKKLLQDRAQPQTVRATISFPSSVEFTNVLSEYIHDIEIRLPPGGKAPKPAEIFRKFLEDNDKELTGMLKVHLAHQGRP